MKKLKKLDKMLGRIGIMKKVLKQREDSGTL